MSINTIDTTGRSNTTGPIVYLLKLLVYHGGFLCLTKIVNDPQLKWILPEDLKADEACFKVCMCHWVFIAYYCRIKKLLIHL